MRLGVLCIELAIIWFIYYLFGVATTYDMPLWLTTFLVIFVDRITTFITSLATSRRSRLRE